MEIALVISSLAGAATAATVSKLPKKNKMPLLGATSKIRAQIDSLKIEKDILTKTISRLYQNDSGLTQIQRDKLLTRYQHQLGVILARIEKMEEASRYPDLGPLGDGLMSLMDQKLSALDKRLAEISSKISVSQAQPEKPEPRKESRKEARIEASIAEVPEAQAQPVKNIEELIRSFAKPATRLELTTLTAIPQNPTFEIPAPQVVPVAEPVMPQVVPRVEEKPEIITHAEKIQIEPKSEFVLTGPIDIEQQVRAEPPKLEYREEKPEPEKRKPKVSIPEPEIEDEEDDLDSIKREIMKTLSKLEQAEVE